MQNYHKHTSWSNIFVPDSAASYEDYAKRAVELGHKIISSVEHGWQGYYYQCFELAQKYNLKFIFGAEAYWVLDRKKEYPDLNPNGEPLFDKNGVAKTHLDKTNAHIVLLAKTEKGRRAINSILSTANEDGYYFKPRVDLELLLSLPASDVMVTSACVAFWKYDNIEEVVLKLKNHFQNNFYLEIQYHNTDSQKKLNRKIQELSKKYGIEMIVGLDSHYIYPEQADERQYILEAKKVEYEDEDGWYMDYPSDEEVMKRFLEQGIFSREEVQRAMDNTDIVLTFDDYSINNPVFSKDIKLPTLYPELTQEERNKKYSVLISKLFKKYVAENNITGDEYQRYYDGVKMEVQTVKDTNLADYFLLDYEIVQKALSMGGILTDSGRGCFTSDAMALTLSGIKHINEVEVGDYVIDQNGKPQKVIDTMEYDCNEEMVQLFYAYGPKTYNPLICTKDHKILIHRNNENLWIEAKDIVKGDYVCVPRIHFEDLAPEYIDLNDYNTFGYAFDDEYIYEYRPAANGNVKFNSIDVAKHIGCSKPWVLQVVNNPNKKQLRHPEYVQRLLDYTGFKSLQEYSDYLKNAHTIKVKRFIKNDELFNTWVGMMYGDGWVRDSTHSTDVGLALSTYGHKKSVNREICLEMVKCFNVPYQCIVHKTRQVEQVIMKSRIVNEFGKQFLFASKKGKQKRFNEKLFYQSEKNLKAILNGLIITDGSVGKEAARDSFDNMSTSVIGAYRILTAAVTDSVTNLVVRKEHEDPRGYHSHTNYKVRTMNNTENHSKASYRTSSDENYIYLPVFEVKPIEKTKRKVYDITVENSHSYVLDSIVVHNSSVGYFTNTLLGFSKVDRFKSPVTLYPERFISKTRILETHSLADIDMNWGTPEIAEEAQKEVIGKDHALPMIAFGTCKKKSAFKLFARSQNMDFELANTISSQIADYEEAVKNADDEDKDLIDIYDYVDKKYEDYINKSKKYWGIIMDKKKAPCAYILYQGNIREEIGLIKCKSESTGKEFITAVVDGAIAENYKFLKNDILTVSIVLLVDKIYNRIGIKHDTVEQLKELVKNDKKTWDIYAKGYTLGVNQCEQSGSVKKMMRFKAKNISELAAWIASIRPSFKSMYSKFESREPFNYGIPAFDRLLQTKELPQSFILYQEQSMSVLAYAGFPMDECYGIIKAIAKKHPEKVKPLKERFIAGFKQKIIADDNIPEKEAQKASEKVWQIINDSCGYGFNSAHAYCMSIDSLYCAYLKANYPYEFYETLLQFHSDRGEKDKVAALKSEMETAFGIKEGQYKFGRDNRKFVIDKENHCIQPSLLSIKGLSQGFANDLYELGKEHFNSFFELLPRLKALKTGNSAKIDTLIRLNYFSDFGDIGKLLMIVKIYEQYAESTIIKKEKCSIDREIMLRFATETEKQYRIIDKKKFVSYLCDNSNPEPYTLAQRLKDEQELLGRNVYVDSKLKYQGFVIDVNTSFSPKITLYDLSTGKTEIIKCYKKTFAEQPLAKGMIITYYTESKSRSRLNPETKQFEKIPNEFEQWFKWYQIRELPPKETK